jgi:plasmid stability protein
MPGHFELATTARLCSSPGSVLKNDLTPTHFRGILMPNNTMLRFGMAEVRVRKLDDFVVAQLREQAERKGTSVEAMLREVISREALRPRQEMIAMIKRHQDEMRQHYGVQPDSTPGIRAARDGLE